MAAGCQVSLSANGDPLGKNRAAGSAHNRTGMHTKPVRGYRAAKHRNSAPIDVN